MNESQLNKVILVTGASTGMGLALAKLLIRDTQHHLVLCARESSMDRFEHEEIMPSSRLWLRVLDVTDFERQQKIVHEINEGLGGVDVLVNNAGVSFRSVIEDMTADDAREQFRVNFFGPMNLVRLVLPLMRKKYAGQIINMSSVGGMMAMPTMGTYSASKFALEGASECLWYEMKPWNIRVNLIEPGFVNSNSFRHVKYTSKAAMSAADKDSPYFKYYYHMGRFVEYQMTRSWSTPESIAVKLLKVINTQSKTLRIPVTLDAWFFYFLRRMMPRWLYHKMLYHSLPYTHSRGNK